MSDTTDNKTQVAISNQKFSYVSVKMLDIFGNVSHFYDFWVIQNRVHLSLFSENKISLFWMIYTVL